MRTQHYRSELELEELRSQAQNERADLARIEAEYAATLARREALERQSTQTSEDAARVTQERSTLSEAIDGLGERLTPLAQEIEASRERELAAAAALAGARGELESIFTRLREVEAGAAEFAARKAERRAHAASLRVELERLESEERKARERAEEREIVAGGTAHRESECRRRLEIAEEALLEARGRAEDVDRDAAQAREEVSRALAAHRDHSVEVKSAESRLHTIEELENSLEGHVPGTRAIVDAWHRGELGGIEGIVSNLIATDGRYARAMDVAFGARLSNVVTATSEDAERCVDYLNRKEAGRATFLPLDTLANREGRRIEEHLAGVSGVFGYAHTLVQADERFAGIVNFLVGNVLIVTTLDVGIELVRERGLRDTIVTLGGEQITGGGAITGGRFVRERSILSRRFVAASLRDALVEMRQRLEAAEHALQAAHVRAEGAIAARDAARERQTSVEAELVGLRAEAAALSADVRRTSAELENARGSVTELLDRAKRLRELERDYEREEPQSEREDEARLSLEAELAKVREEIARAEAAQSATNAQGSELRERAAGLSAEREASKARLAILDQDSERGGVAREEMLAQIAALMEQTRTTHAHVEGLRSGITTLDSRLEAARARREELSSRQAQLESEVRAADQNERDTAASGENDRTRLAQLEAELGMLVSQFAQNPASGDECADVEQRYREEPDAIVDELPRLRDELARLQANVNLNAESERNEVAEREQFLRAQMDDLTQARETLLESIHEIERETQIQFNETFERVSEAFTAMYGRLFAGGEAKMWQTQPEDLSETGIEMAVRPPGKKQMPLAALSGGERAMTAAALIFALIATKPAPFYLLDEVDAALDDANIDRFCAMVREFAAESQMLIVTHNKKTMEMADRIYGVTARDAGVSTIVSAELVREAEAMPA